MSELTFVIIRYALDTMSYFFIIGGIVILLGTLFPTHSEDEEVHEDNCVPMNLGDRMKYYENQSASVDYIKPYELFNVRIDGRSFNKKTHKLPGLPFNELFIKAMRSTAHDLMKEFHPSTVHVQSDEITLVFPAWCTENEYTEGTYRSEHIFGGSVPRIITNISGYASVRFTCHMFNLLRKQTDNEISYKEYLNTLMVGSDMNSTLSFDARVTIFPVGKPEEAVNNILWRSTYDGYRNFVSMLARSVFSTRELDRVSTLGRIAMLKEKGIDVETYPAHLKYGWFIKSVPHEEEHVRDNKKKNAIRIKQRAVSFKVSYSNTFFSFLFSDFLPNNIKYLEEVNLY